MSKEKAMEHLKAAMSILEAVEKEQKPEMGFEGDTQMEGDYAKKSSEDKSAKKKMLAMAMKKKGMA